MNGKQTRLKALGRELSILIETTDAVVFLDRYARCSAYSDAELDSAGLSEVMDKAFELSENHNIRETAGAMLNLDDLRRRVRSIAGTDEDVGDLVSDVLLVATIANWLPVNDRHEVNSICDELCKAIASLPVLFATEAGPIARDRARYEPDGQPEQAQKILYALRAAENQLS